MGHWVAGAAMDQEESAEESGGSCYASRGREWRREKRKNARMVKRDGVEAPGREALELANS